jgi:hypothetical protein
MEADFVEICCKITLNSLEADRLAVWGFALFKKSSDLYILKKKE